MDICVIVYGTVMIYLEHPQNIKVLYGSVLKLLSHLHSTSP